jgi:hypothetical protein
MGELVYPAVYEKWRVAMNLVDIDKGDLVKEMDEIGHLFATKLVARLKVRFEPYMDYYHAMEVIDPTAPALLGEGTWPAVEDICKRYGLSFPDVRLEIIAMRDDAVDLSSSEVAMCKANLLNLYREQYLSSPADQRRPHLEMYARVVFQLPFETVLIESLFSIMNYNKDKKRASLNDETVASVIHTRDVAKVIDDVATPFAATDLDINVKRALEHRLTW